MSWKSPCRPSGKSCHKIKYVNKAVANFTECLSTWLVAATGHSKHAELAVELCKWRDHSRRTMRLHVRNHSLITCDVDRVVIEILSDDVCDGGWLMLHGVSGNNIVTRPLCRCTAAAYWCQFVWLWLSYSYDSFARYVRSHNNKHKLQFLLELVAMARQCYT